MALPLETDTGNKTVLYAMQTGLVIMGALALNFALSLPSVICGVILLVLYLFYVRHKKIYVGHVSLQGKKVLITGCDTGFGHELAKDLHTRGCHVIATCFRPEGSGAKALSDVKSDRMTVLPLDISSDESVAQCLSQVKVICKRTGLWGLVNNAGHNFMGDVELTTMRQYLMVGNINIYGMVRTTRAFLPLLRLTKGRILNVTSAKGRASVPLNAAYNITKYAGESFSEITSMEMRQFGVKVVIIEPGNFGGATGCMNKEGLARIRKEYEETWSEATPEVKEVFTRKYLDNTLRQMDNAALSTGPTLTPVIDTMVEALTSNDPDLRYLIDGSNQFFDLFNVLIYLKPYLSDRFFQSLVLFFFPYKVDS